MFYNNKELEDRVVKINQKKEANIIEQKRQPIPLHLQEQVAEELKRLIKNGYLERAIERTDECFVSLSVIPVKKDK